MQLHLVVIGILVVLGFAGAWYWINRPLPADPQRGDDVFDLREAINRDDRTICRRFIEAAVGVLVFAGIGGALAGILSRTGAW